MREPKTLLSLLAIPAGILTGGVLGFLLAFGAVLVLIDRMLDRVTGSGDSAIGEAQRRFRALARERRRAGETALTYLETDTGHAAIAPRRRLGVQPIEVASIVGSVDAHKAASFDADFRPPVHSRGRWTLLYAAARRGAQLPPISVYRVRDAYYVRDGHHRVSVARAMGVDAIDADVVELRIRGLAPLDSRSRGAYCGSRRPLRSTIRQLLHTADRS